MAQLDQDAFRIRNDDGDETTATWKAALNTSIPIAINEPFRVRFVVQNTGSAYSSYIYAYYRINGDTWYRVGAGVVDFYDSSSITDGEATTQQIGSGTFNAGKMFESSALVSINAGEETEIEAVLELGAVSNEDTVEVRLYESILVEGIFYLAVPFLSYTNTLSFTATISNDGTMDATDERDIFVGVDLHEISGTLDATDNTDTLAVTSSILDVSEAYTCKIDPNGIGLNTPMRETR